MQSYTMRTINALNGTMATNNKVIKTESDHGDGSVSVPDAAGASGKQACWSYWCWDTNDDDVVNANEVILRHLQVFQAMQQ